MSEDNENGWVTLVAIVGLGALLVTGGTVARDSGPEAKPPPPPAAAVEDDRERPDNFDRVNALDSVDDTGLSLDELDEGLTAPPPRKLGKAK